LAKEILELSDKIEDDNPVKVQRARLQVDSRKWLAARLAPKKYGDQVQHEHKGGVNFQPQILIQCSSDEGEGFIDVRAAPEAAGGAPQQDASSGGAKAALNLASRTAIPQYSAHRLAPRQAAAPTH